MNRTFLSLERFPLVVNYVLSLLLFSAASLKLYGFNVSPYAEYGWFSSPLVRIVVVLWELFLGLWLLSGAYRKGVWFATFGTFLFFSIVSGYLGWIGQANCGCFGVLKTSPWWVFTVDVLVIVTLILVRSSWHRLDAFSSGVSHIQKSIVSILFGAVLILCVLSVVATVVYGSLDVALARLQGLPLYSTR